MKNFPDVFDLIPNPVEQIFSNPVGILGTLFCSNWAYKDKCVLLGDAAHTMLPFYSQAMNSGYNDCFILDKFIDDYGYEEAFEKYSQHQRPNTDIMSKMAMDHYVDLSERILDSKFMLQRQAEVKLMNAFSNYRSLK